MDNVYNNDIFKYQKNINNKGFIDLKGKKYPVYTINNNLNLSSIDLINFLMYNVSEVLKFYKKFKEENKYEYE